jgi:hypothetical protein
MTSPSGGRPDGRSLIATFLCFSQICFFDFTQTRDERSGAGASPRRWAAAPTRVEHRHELARRGGERHVSMADDRDRAGRLVLTQRGSTQGPPEPCSILPCEPPQRSTTRDSGRSTVTEVSRSRKADAPGAARGDV